jgi:hypothetical protein
VLPTGRRLPLEPLLLLLQRHRPGRHAERAQRLEVADPAVVERQQVAPQRPERDQVADDVDDGRGLDCLFHRALFPAAACRHRAGG